MSRSKPAQVLTCLLLAAVSLLAGCEDKKYPGYLPTYSDGCEGLACTEGTCVGRQAPVPICISPSPDGGDPESTYRLALPDTFLPLPTTGEPVEGTIEVSAFGGGSRFRYFEFEATEQHVYRLTATFEDMEGCDIFVADAQGMVFHAASSAYNVGPVPVDTSFRPLRAGRHVIAFASRNEQALSRYSLRLQALADDHGDLAESATPLPAGDVTFEGTLQAFADTDVFSFSAQAGERFQVLCTFPGTSEQTASLTRVFSVAGELATEGLAEDGVVRTTEAGPHFIHVGGKGAGSLTPLSYRCGLRNLTHDDHGDTLAEATPLGASATVDGWFQARGDADVFQVELALDAYYLVSCSTPNGTSCSFRVANAAGGVLMERLHVTNAPPATVVALSAGVHQIQVRGSGVHRYQLQFRLGGTDEHGDSAEQATVVQPGSSNGELQGPDDIDFFAVDTLAGHGYIFTCASSPGTSSLSMVVRDAEGNVVPPLSFSNPRVEVVPVAAGRYTLQVQGVAWAPVPTPYSCTFEDRGQDAHGNTPEQATAISLPATVRGRLEVSADVDVHAFTGTAGQFISLRLDVSSGGTFGGTLRLLNAAGMDLANATADRTFALRLPTSGTYFIEVRGAANDYTVELQDLGMDDHGQTLETATALSLGVTASGNLQGGWDQDVFSLPATVGRFYRLTCVPEVPNPLGACNVHLLGGNTLAFQATPPGGHVWLFDVSVSGTVGISIVGTGTFTLRVEEAALDDHGGQPERATPLTLGSTQAGTLEVGIDEDLFVMPLEPEGRYRLQLTAGFRLRYAVQDPSTWGSFFVASDGTFVAGSSTQVLIRVVPYFGEAGPALGAYQVRIDRSSL